MRSGGHDVMRFLRMRHCGFVQTVAMCVLLLNVVLNMCVKLRLINFNCFKDGFASSTASRRSSSLRMDCYPKH